MWTFDRYQRWMEQKTDWIRPSAVRSPPSEEMVKVVNVPAAAPAQPQQPEISIDEDIDLNELAELARKIEERTR